jgi:hypothetical protein
MRRSTMRASNLSSRIVLNAIVLLIATWLATPVCADPTWRWSGIERVVAFGDVHGAYRELVGLLQQTRVIDTDLHWSGGATHLVSLGDLVDRGPDSRAVMDLLMRLEVEAPESGGYVHLVLGNHEAMNLTGDDRYVSDAEYASFADPSSQSQSRPGETELRAAFAANGRYGGWLLVHPALIVINDTAYVHGGLPASIAELGLVDGNARFHEELAHALIPDAAPGPLLADAGPLWYRGTARCHALIEARRLQRGLDRLAVSRVAIGHTPTRTLRVSSRFGGRVVMLDTGMLAQVYHGRASALVVEHGADRVVVSGSDGADAVTPDPTGYSGNFDASDRTSALLASARIAASTPVIDGKNGERDVELETANGPVLARFVPLSKDRLRHEVAAYRLDRLLGLGIVSPAVEREVGGKRGLVTVTNDGWYSERQRLASGTPHANECEAGSDYLLMSAFDALIGNEARTADNLGYDRSSAELRLRDQGGAFGQSALRRNPQEPAPKLPAALRDRLIALDERALVEALGDQLRSREIKAMLQRRDTIVGDWAILE